MMMTTTIDDDNVDDDAINSLKRISEFAACVTSSLSDASNIKNNYYIIK